ncbi:stage III sporulation protein AA [Pseudogracilibacillus sp. ICA-222130]|uniref:stage III sporulation protein AA n=1 Tax=Pseudogracilibacillus sp. ICA-222130 TaxID=3134655 RepID=UPI0030BFD779
MEEIFQLFSPNVKKMLEEKVYNQSNQLEEIRLRIQKPIELNFFQNHILLDYTFTEQERMYFLRQLTNHSIYRMDEPFKQGFLTISGGHRIGFSGEVLTDEKKIKEATFFNIRIAQEIKGIAKPLLNNIKEGNTLQHTIIFGAPQTGKTTLLRDLAKQISDDGMISQKVAIVDERSELAACKNGIPQLDIGVRTDIMDNCLKQFGMFMMIRSMSPQILIIDEIGSIEDVQAILEAIRTGVTIICTAHSNNMDELMERPQLKSLFEQQLFKRFVHVTRDTNGAFSFTMFHKKNEKMNFYKVHKR